MIDLFPFDYLPVDRIVEFWVYHADNPHIYELFVVIAKERMAEGFDNYSARYIFHDLRWRTDVTTIDDEPYKVNDKFSPFYARLFHRDYPEHDGFFRTRAAIADADPSLLVTR